MFQKTKHFMLFTRKKNWSKQRRPSPKRFSCFQQGKSPKINKEASCMTDLKTHAKFTYLSQSELERQALPLWFWDWASTVKVCLCFGTAPSSQRGRRSSSALKADRAHLWAWRWALITLIGSLEWYHRWGSGNSGGIPPRSCAAVPLLANPCDEVPDSHVPP